MNGKAFTALCFLILSVAANAQVINPEKVFESKQGYLFDLGYSMHAPLKDMADRFGNNSALGLGINYKFKNQWTVGVQYQWLFGQAVKETNMLDSISGNDGNILDQNGNIAVIRFFERGHTGYIQAGRLFPLGEINRNSGVLVQAGVGFMLHKVYIYSSKTTVPQLSEEYKKGYDRLAAGYSFRQFIGYQNIDPKKRLNFIAGIEFQQGFTTAQRSFDYDRRMKDTRNRVDILIGPKIALVLPVLTKKKNDEEFFTD